MASSEGVDSNAVQPEWMKDSSSRSCLICNALFTFTKRRHHCRRCGRLVCASCSSRRAALARGEKARRVCDDCFYSVSLKENVQSERNYFKLREDQLLLTGSWLSTRLLRVYLLDGSFKTLSFQGDTTAEALCRRLAPRLSLALFEVEKDMRDPEDYRFVPPDDRLEDIVTRWKLRAAQESGERDSRAEDCNMSAKLVLPLYRLPNLEKTGPRVLESFVKGKPHRQEGASEAKNFEELYVKKDIQTPERVKRNIAQESPDSSAAKSVEKKSPWFNKKRNGTAAAASPELEKTVQGLRDEISKLQQNIEDLQSENRALRTKCEILRRHSIDFTQRRWKERREQDSHTVPAVLRTPSRAKTSSGALPGAENPDVFDEAAPSALSGHLNSSSLVQTPPRSRASGADTVVSSIIDDMDARGSGSDDWASEILPAETSSNDKNGMHEETNYIKGKQILISGALKKRSTYTGRWQKRFFILQKRTMDSVTSTSKGVACVLDEWENVENYRAGYAPYSSIPHEHKSGNVKEQLVRVISGASAFQIVLVTTSRSYHFQAYGRIEYGLWFDALSKAIQENQEAFSDVANPQAAAVAATFGAPDSVATSEEAQEKIKAAYRGAMRPYAVRREDDELGEEGVAIQLQDGTQLRVGMILDKTIEMDDFLAFCHTHLYSDILNFAARSPEALIIGSELVADIQQLCANICIYAEAWTQQYKLWLQAQVDRLLELPLGRPDLLMAVFTVMQREGLLLKQATVDSIHSVIRRTFHGIFDQMQRGEGTTDVEDIAYGGFQKKKISDDQRFPSSSSVSRLTQSGMVNSLLHDSFSREDDDRSFASGRATPQIDLDELDKQSLTDLLHLARSSVATLHLVVNDLLPILPKELNVLQIYKNHADLIVQEYFLPLYSSLKADIHSRESVKDALELLSWAEDVKFIMGKFGDSQLDEAFVRISQELLNSYVKHTSDLMAEWQWSIWEREFASTLNGRRKSFRPYSLNDESLGSSWPEDLLSCLESQLTVVTIKLRGGGAGTLAKAIIESLSTFRQNLTFYMLNVSATAFSPDAVCGVCNDIARLVEGVNVLGARAEAAMEEHAAAICHRAVEGEVHEWNNLNAEVLLILVEIVNLDVEKVLSNELFTEAWLGRRSLYTEAQHGVVLRRSAAMKVLSATLMSWCNDIWRWIRETDYKEHFLSSLLKKIVRFYILRFLQICPRMSDIDGERRDSLIESEMRGSTAAESTSAFFAESSTVSGSSLLSDGTHEGADNRETGLVERVVSDIQGIQDVFSEYDDLLPLASIVETLKPIHAVAMVLQLPMDVLPSFHKDTLIPMFGAQSPLVVRHCMQMREGSTLPEDEYDAETDNNVDTSPSSASQSSLGRRGSKGFGTPVRTESDSSLYSTADTEMMERLCERDLRNSASPKQGIVDSRIQTSLERDSPSRCISGVIDLRLLGPKISVNRSQAQKIAEFGTYLVTHQMESRRNSLRMEGVRQIEVGVPVPRRRVDAAHR